MFAWLPASFHSNHPVNWYPSIFALKYLYRIFHFHFEAEISLVLMLSPIRATLIRIHFQGLISLDWVSRLPSNCEEMMTNLKSIEISSFTFDIILSYCFLVVLMLMMSQSQSRTPYDVTTMLYIPRIHRPWSWCTPQWLYNCTLRRSTWHIHVCMMHA